MTSRTVLLVSSAALATVIAIGTSAFSQNPGRGGGGGGSADEPFKGVTANGTVQPGLYSIRSTGVSTEPVRKAAEAFIAGLTAEQRKGTLYPVDDKEWRLWNNVHRYQRQGVSFKEMTEKQRELAFGLMSASLSAKGLKKSQDIMKLNGTIAELTNNFNDYGEWLYHLTIMGQPSATEPWGWQMDGHHLIINYFVLRDQVVMTPIFMGSEPVRAAAGKFAGTVVLQDEQNKGLALMAALQEDQRKKAIIQPAKTANNAVAQAFRDNLVLDYAGLPVSQMTDAQKKLLLAIVEEYVNNIREGHARVRMDDVRKHLDQTYFAWIGETRPDSVFYYRIHSPVILIEFDHQTPIALPGPRVPNHDHIHSVVRTPNGNDYGKDLLRQHYEQKHNLNAGFTPDHR